MITLQERYLRPDGRPAVGTVAVRPVVSYTLPTHTVTGEWVSASVDGNGEWSVDIDPHDAADTNPSPIHYLVYENVPECSGRSSMFALPASIPDGASVRIGQFRSQNVANIPPAWSAIAGDNTYWGYGHDPAVDQYAAGGVRDGETPAVDEARIFGPAIEVWDGAAWVAVSTGPGDEYIDLVTGEVFAITP